VADIEARLHERAEKVITSREVGELVMDHLKRVDQVAYVRFASVYNAFQDVSQFSETVNQLQGLLHQKAKPVVAAVHRPGSRAKTSKCRNKGHPAALTSGGLGPSPCRRNRRCSAGRGVSTHRRCLTMLQARS